MWDNPELCGYHGGEASAGMLGCPKNMTHEYVKKRIEKKIKNRGKREKREESLA